MLPDSRVLTFGGQYTGTLPATTPLQSAGLVPNCTKVADLYDPGTNAFRAVADMNRFIHYHSIAVLAPDGHVLATISDLRAVFPGFGSYAEQRVRLF